MDSNKKNQEQIRFQFDKKETTEQQGSCLNNFQVIDEGEARQESEAFFESAYIYCNNNDYYCEGNDDEVSFSETLKRNGDINKNMNQIYERYDAQIQLNNELQCKKLNKKELVRAMNSLRKYQMNLLKHISSGGEADVYLGNLLKNTGEKVEVVFRIVKAFQKEQIPEIKEEYKRITQIKHPRNLVYYEGLIEVGDLFIFIMKYYPDCLKNKMKTKLTNHQFWQIIFDLFDGLVELRSYLLIHSDIKPSNVLINDQGKCVYSDFGMALKLKIRQQATNEMKGLTYKYSSPESSNRSILSYASDMYSLGIVIIELSQSVLDQSVSTAIEMFIKENVLILEPEKRVPVEELIPLFLKKNALIIDNHNLQRYLAKVQKINLSLKEKNNEFVNFKIRYSYTLVEIMLVYIINGKSELISFNSLNDTSFQSFPLELVVKLLIDAALIPGDTISYCQKQKYLEQVLLDLEQLPPDKETINYQFQAEKTLGNIFSLQPTKKQALEHYNIALKLLLEHFPTHLYEISQMHQKIGEMLIILNCQAEGKQMILLSIEGVKNSQEKQIFIQQFFSLAQYYENENDKVNSLKYYQGVINNWKEFQQFILESVETIAYKNSMLKSIAISLQKLGQYEDFINVWILHLKRINLENENLTFFQKFHLAKMFHDIPAEQIKGVLNIIFKLESSIVKQLLLLEIAFYYFEIRDLKSAIDTLNECDQMETEKPLIIQILLTTFYYELSCKMNNLEEAERILQGGLILIDKPEMLKNPSLLYYSMVLFFEIVQKDKLKDEAIKWFIKVEEQVKNIKLFYLEQQQLLLELINYQKELHQEDINRLKFKE